MYSLLEYIRTFFTQTYKSISYEHVYTVIGANTPWHNTINVSLLESTLLLLLHTYKYRAKKCSLYLSSNKQ